MQTFLKKIFLVAIFALLGISCQSNETQKTNRKKYNSTLHQISFEYPENCEVKYDTDSMDKNSNIIVNQTIQDGQDFFQENVTISHEFLPIALSDSLFHKTSIAQIKIANPELKVEDKGLIKFDANSFHQYQFQFTTNDSSSYEVNGFTIVKDSIGYIFNVTEETSKQNKFLTSIEPILNTFKALK